MASNLYASLTDDIKGKILTGQLAPGEKLPSENTLMQEYGLSKTTVSKSLQTLANEGYIVSQPRIGNFVRQNLSTPYQFHYDEERSLMRHAHKVTVTGIKTLDTATISYEKVYWGESLPICISFCTFVPANVASIQADVLTQNGLIALLETYRNLHNIYKSITVQAVGCPSDLCEKFSLSPQDIMALVTRKYFTTDHQLVASSCSYMLHDYFDLHLSSSL